MNQFQSFDEVFSALKRRAFLMAIIFVMGCVASVFFALNQVKVYQAISVVQIENASVKTSVVDPAAATSDTALRIRLIEQRLMSRDNLVSIIDQFGLYADTNLTLIQKVIRLRESVKVEQIMSTAEAWQPGATPSALLITATHTTPQTAADLANTFMSNVIEFSRERSVSQAENTVSFYQEEESRIRAQLDVLSDKVADYKSENAKFLAAGQTAMRAQLADLRENELEIAQQIVALNTGSNRQRQEVTRQQVALLENQRALIQTRIAAIEGDLLAAPAYEREFTALELELGRLEAQMSNLTQRRAEAEMGQLLEDRQQGGRFVALETAEVPEDPMTRSRKKTAILGAAASGIIALAVAFTLEMANPVIRNAAQMERALGLQPVVEIPLISSKGQRRRAIWARVFSLIALIAGASVVMRLLQDRVLDAGMFLSTERP